MTDADEAVEAAVRNLDVPWMLMQDNEAGAGWDWIVVVPGGENIVGLSEVVARRIATDHSASLTAASAHTGGEMPAAIPDDVVEAAAKAMIDMGWNGPAKEVARAALNAALQHRPNILKCMDNAEKASPASTTAHTGERMARAIEALLPEIEEAEIGHGGGSHDDECPTCAAIKEAGASLDAYRSAPRPSAHTGERMARALDLCIGALQEDAPSRVQELDWARDALDAYRSTRPPEPMAGAVEGWKLVPVEPTEEMLKAGGRAMSGTSPSWYLNNPGNVWPAMLSAAPAPPIAQASAPVSDGAASDLVERLIEWADAAGLSGRDTLACDLREAADRIEAQAARIERLEAALRVIAASPPSSHQQVEAAKRAFIETWPAFRQWLTAGELALVTEEGNFDPVPDEPFIAALTAASPPPPDGWRGIESAPKDGSEYHLHSKTATYVGSWRIGHSDEPQPAEVAWRASCCGRFTNPTHWRSLPSPPGEELGKG